MLHQSDYVYSVEEIISAFLYTGGNSYNDLFLYERSIILWLNQNFSSYESM